MLGCWGKLDTGDQLLQIVADMLVLVLKVSLFSSENSAQNLFEPSLITLFRDLFFLRATDKETQRHTLPHSWTHLHIKIANIPREQLANQHFLDYRQILFLNAERGDGLLKDGLFIKRKQDGFDLGEDVLDKRVGVNILIDGEELLQPGQSLGNAEPVVTRLQVSQSELVEVLHDLVDYCLAGC